MSATNSTATTAKRKNQRGAVSASTRRFMPAMIVIGVAQVAAIAIVAVVAVAQASPLDCAVGARAACFDPIVAVVAQAVAPATVVAVAQAFRPASIAPQSKPATTNGDITRWMTELSNWGRWGKDDQRGTLNLITPAKRKEALALVREGLSVSLAHTLDKEPFADNPRPIGQQMT